MRRIHSTTLRLRFVLLLACIAPGVHAQDTAQAAAGDASLGLGMQRIRGWVGEGRARSEVVPLFDIEHPGRYALSSADGASVNLLRDTAWEAGPYGDLVWGRTHSELGPRLSRALKSIPNRIVGGAYVERRIGHGLSAGSHLVREIGGAGAYVDLYADLDLLAIGYLHHGLEAGTRWMNAAAVRERFAATAPQAAMLRLGNWQPRAGLQTWALQYQAFMPTSQHTGIALQLESDWLHGSAAGSPLVRQFGRRHMGSALLGAVYRF